MSIRFANGYVFFWGDWPSNWEYSPFVLNGARYNCVEQYMMAEKARLFNDEQSLKLIMDAKDPAIQKRLGRNVRGFTNEKWVPIRYGVVLRGTLEKYRQNPNLRRLLLATLDDVFVEASPHDCVWGIGMGKNDPGVEKPINWRGQNLLGKAITEARKTIRKEFANE